MISRKFKDHIVNQSEDLVKKWCEEVRKSDFMKTYQRFPDDQLMKVNKIFFDHLAKWIVSGLSRKEIGNYFVELGKERYYQKIPLSEIHYAVYLAKNVVYNTALAESLLDSAMEVYQVMELGKMIANFFDTGNFYITRGYLEAMYAVYRPVQKVYRKGVEPVLSPRLIFSSGSSSCLIKTGILQEKGR